MDKQLFAKLINGELEIAPHHYQDNDTYIMNFNECEELMIQFGYKPVVGDLPEYDFNTQDALISYKEERKCIRRYCEIIDKAIPQFEVDDINEVEEKTDKQYETLIKENEELKRRIEELEAKQQETYNMVNSFINEVTQSINKVNELDTKMIGVKNSINTFNQFIDFYNSINRD